MGNLFDLTRQIMHCAAENHFAPALFSCFSSLLFIEFCLQAALFFSYWIAANPLLVLFSNENIIFSTAFQSIL